MEGLDNYDALDQETMIRFVSLMFEQLNIGLLIYHLEDDDLPDSLRLKYANPAAGTYTGADLSPRIGKTILDAFPGMANTSLPDDYAEIVRSRKPRNFGVFEYRGDDDIDHSYYAVKAFPIPNNCLGVVFDNITARKKLESLVKNMHSE